MKKILLVTLQGANYGNRLQNYALQKILEEFGFDVYTPYYEIPERDTYNKKVRYYMKCFLARCGIKKYRYVYSHLEKEKSFEKFNKQYISHMFKISFKRAFESNWDEYTYAVTGSDQIWHKWSCDEYELRYFYLQFMPKNKRISYAASFGFKEIPETNLGEHKEYLLGMNNISCREEEGAQIINSLIGIEPVVVCDPTFLLSKEQWLEIEKRPEYIENSKYVLMYFLGEMESDRLSEIKRYSEDNKCKIIDLMNYQNLDIYKTRPDEFLWLVSNSEHIFTDSYHMTVFSLIFEKNFTIFKRVGEGFDQMFGRLEKLITKYGLESNVFDGSIRTIELDFKGISKKIEIEVEASKEFLRDCLSN